MYASRLRAGAARALSRALFSPAGASRSSLRGSPAGSAAASSATAGILHAQPMCAALAAAPIGGSSLGGSARAFSSAAADAAAGAGSVAASAAGGEDGEEGRDSASAAATGSAAQQGESQRAIDPILEIDPYPKERMAALEKRYEWVDWNDMAKHLHMGDVHFFDQEVPYTDTDFTIRPDFRLLHRLEGANRLKTLQEHEDKKIMRLLDTGYWITEGRNTRVATEGKVSSVWTLVIAGDQNGTGSYGFGKGKDMAIAETRAMADLRRNMLFVPLFESRTLSHEIRGKHGVCQVRMWPRPRLHGMTAGMIPRLLFDCFGIEDITAKVDGRALPHHQVLAIFNGLREVKVLREEAARRGVTAHKMYERGLAQPRHPGRKELLRRGEEITKIMREIRATQLHESLNEVPEEQQTYWEPDRLASPIHSPNHDNIHVPWYIEERPEAIESERHTPAPLFPNSKRAAIKETMFKRRGLPKPSVSHRTLQHTRAAGRH